MDHAPDAVRAVDRFFSERHLWRSFSRNAHDAPVGSCREAASRRMRLGHEGIPLHDELKSFAAGATLEGRAYLIAAHVRGDRQLSLDRLARAVEAESEVTRLSSLDLKYGLVNPFLIESTFGMASRGVNATAGQPDVIQVFDKDLLTRIGIPGSCMTNAGDPRWGVEFYPDEVLEAVPSWRIAEIAQPDPRAAERTQFRKLGILTGNPPEAGLALHALITARIRDLLGDHCAGDFSLPEVMITSLPETGLSMELRSRLPLVWKALEGAVVDLCHAGCVLIALPCNTLSFFEDELADLAIRHGAEFVSLPQACRSCLDKEGIKTLAIIGIPEVARLRGGSSAYDRALDGLDVEVPDGNTLDLVKTIAYDVKARGPESEAARNHLRDVVKTRVQSPVVLLALTELSLIVQRRKVGFGQKRVIDPLQAYADVLVDKIIRTEETNRVSTTTDLG